MPLDKRHMYRMPWSLTDNPIGWLEVTDICNINCKGCYRSHLAGHRDIEELKTEVRMFKELRNCDGISIAGGEPLLYPHLPELIAHVRKCGMKPVLLSNGLELDHAALVELKKAGLGHLTLHVDQWQTRPGWTGHDEVELVELRQQIADRVADVGGYHVTFGCTVYNENLHQVTAIADWALRNAAKVDGLVFITYRAVPAIAHVEYESSTQKVAKVAAELSYTTDSPTEIQISSAEVWERLHEQDPDFHSGAYLGGTVRHSSFKWIVTGRILNKHRVYGYAGPRMMETLQIVNHALHGTYPAYQDRSKLGPLVFTAGLMDPFIARGARKYLSDIVRHPRRALAPVSVQSIIIVQAPDLLPDGTCDMCDSCPDMTFYKGELVHSCRWDEYRKYGMLLRATWKGDERLPASEPAVERAQPTEDQASTP
jgi:pyruvate-formate lyase-activating enzyme